MSIFDGFVNIHPFFVHAPVGLIPIAATMIWVGRKIKKDGFDTATFLIVVAAALASIASMLSGLQASDTVPQDAALAELVWQHKINSIVVTIVTSVVALLAIADWRRWIKWRLWWVRGALLTWAAIGVAFSAHGGATLVYKHGAAVVRSK
jgi:uncharacterized membrane protein